VLSSLCAIVIVSLRLDLEPRFDKLTFWCGSSASRSSDCVVVQKITAVGLLTISMCLSHVSISLSVFDSSANALRSFVAEL
jgi:hypothetical protein